MSKAAFNTVLADNIKDNNNNFITPARHRTTLQSLRDFVGWLAEINTWTAMNVFSGGTREAWFTFAVSSTVTVTSALNHQLIPAGVSAVNLPASPTDGDWYCFKNISGETVTLSGNGHNIYTSSGAGSRTIGTGGSYKVRYDQTTNLWYNYT